MPPPRRDEALSRVAFALNHLPASNGHFIFERICFEYARSRISSRFLPPTGPVAAKGDQGRDSETHWSEVGEVDTLGAGGELVLACTTQSGRLGDKIRRDLRKLARRDGLRVFYFSLGNVAVGVRHDLQSWAERELGIQLEILDGSAVARALLDDDLRWVAREFLAVPLECDESASRIPSSGPMDTLERRALSNDVAAPYYPSTMRPSTLAESMTVTRLNPSTHGVALIESDTQLYSSAMRTRGGESAYEALSRERRAVLLGNPGTGKSTVLTGLVTRKVSGPGKRPALCVRLSDIGSAPGDPQTMRDAVLTAVGSSGTSPESVHDITDALIGGDDALLVLDGLDEVLGAEPNRRVATILQLLAEFPGSVVVASRISGYRGVPFETQEFAVDLLEPEQIRAFVETWFGNPRSAGRRRILTAMRSAGLIDLMAIPVMAGFAAFVAESEAVPVGMAALYERYVSLFLQRFWKERHHQRVDFLEVGDLVDTAEELAWVMATRPSAVVEVDDTWIDVIDLNMVRRLLPRRSRELGALVTIDGMLVPHGLSKVGPLLQQEYRWIHRTIHEHLAGKHLVHWLEADFESAFTYLARAAQRPRTWKQVLVHTFGLVSDELCLQLDGRFDALIRQGDPEGIIRSSAGELAVRAETLRGWRSPREAVVAAFARAPGRACDVVPLLSREAITWVADALVAHEVDVDLAVFPRLLASLQRRGESGFAFDRVLDLCASMDTAVATRVLLEDLLLQPSLFGGAFKPEWKLWSIGVGPLRTIYDVASAQPDVMSATRFVTLLIHLKGGADYLTQRQRRKRSETLAHAEVLASQYLGLTYEDRDGDVALWGALLRGVHGEVAAWAAGESLLPVERARQHADLHPWAEAAVLANELTSAKGPREVFTEVTPAAARKSLRDARRGDMSLDQTLGVLRSLHVLFRSTDSGDLMELLDFWARLSGPLFEGRDRWPPRPGIDPSQLAWAASLALDDRPWDDIWPVIQRHWEANSTFRPLVESHSVLRDHVECEERESKIHDVLIWGSGRGIPVFGSLPAPKHPSEFIHLLVKKRAVTYLRNVDNVRGVVDWLITEGALPYWRPFLLAETEAAAVSYVGRTE